MTTIPPAIATAIDAAVEAYRAKLEVESVAALAVHSGQTPPDTVAPHNAHVNAHGAWANVVLAEGLCRPR